MTKKARTGFTREDAPNDLGYQDRVTYDPGRAAKGLPPWRSEHSGYYTDSEIIESK